MLDELGYAWHPSVLTPAEVGHCRSLLARDYDARPHMAHSELLWWLRRHPRVRECFARAYGTDDLVTGFDGAGWQRPGDEAFELPWHVDQDGSHAPDALSCVQGILALSAHQTTSGGLQVLPRSHLRHAQLLRAAGHVDGDEWEYVELDLTDTRRSVQPRLQPGDLFLWDSRLAHRVVPPRCAATAVERATAYLSFQPSAWLDARLRRLRRRAFERGEHTTHWCTRVVCRGPSEQSAAWDDVADLVVGR